MRKASRNRSTLPLLPSLIESPPAAQLASGKAMRSEWADPDDIRPTATKTARTIRRGEPCATTAPAVLAEALADAQTEAAAATKAADIAAATLSMVLAEQMAKQVFVHEAEAQRLREALHGADVVDVVPPAPVRAIYGDGSRFLRLVARGPWQALRARLLADPQAPLELESAG